jgi:hypothetical protein
MDISTIYLSALWMDVGSINQWNSKENYIIIKNQKEDTGMIN